MESFWDLSKDAFLNDEDPPAAAAPGPAPKRGELGKRELELVTATWLHFRSTYGQERPRSGDGHYLEYRPNDGVDVEAKQDVEAEQAVNKESLRTALVNLITEHNLANDVKWPKIEALLLAANPNVGSTIAESLTEVSQIIAVAKVLYNLSRDTGRLQ
jgi:hypothetical protein